jgi:hypothetical protein
LNRQGARSPGSLCSTLPSDFRAAGYKVIEASERIIVGTIIERLTRTSSSALEFVTPGSTKPVVEVVSHAGVDSGLQELLRRRGYDAHPAGTAPLNWSPRTAPPKVKAAACRATDGRWYMNSG